MEKKLIRKKEKIPCKHGHDLHYNCPGLMSDLNDCNISDYERKIGVNINDLVKE